MALIKITLQTAGPHAVNDLGITLSGGVGTIIDLSRHESNDISQSNDLAALATAGDIQVIDPRDDTDATFLNAADSVRVLRGNQWGIIGGRFANLDDPTATLSPDSVVSIDSTGTVAIAQPLSTLLASTDNTSAVQSIVGDMLNDDANLTIDAGQISLEDNFLKNTGDTLDSGTLVIASGATIEIATGADLTIADAPINPTDAVNKEYVDMIASGNDMKDPVRVATTGNITKTFTDNGGVGDKFTGVANTLDGVTLVDGDRVLVKDQNDATRNGIYVYSGGDLIRATDQDGSVDGEISAANTVFVIEGSVGGGATYTVAGSGELTVNVDDIVWLQSGSTTTYSNGVGIALTGTQFSLDVETLPSGTITTQDELAFNSVLGNNDSNKTTVADFLAELDIVTSSGVGGFSVQTSDDVYQNRTLEVEGVGNLGGLVVESGDGIAGNPTFGLDIQNTAPQTTISNSDKFIGWNSDINANVSYTLEDILGEVTPTFAFTTWALSGNTTGSTSIEATTQSDTATISGGAGINIDASTKELTLSITKTGLISTATAATDSIVLFDASNNDAPIIRSIGDLIDDQDLISEVEVSITAGLEGLDVLNGDGVAGNPVIGLDIDGLVNPAPDLAATDKLAVFDGTSNVGLTGQQVADGVAEILNMPALTLSTINGQPVITLVDTTRGDKALSIDSNQLAWSNNDLDHNEWMRVGDAGDADSGYIAPLDGTIVWATAHCEDADNDVKDIHVYVNAVDQGSLGNLSGTDNATFVNSTVDIDFNQGDRIRLRAVGAASGDIKDTIASIHLKWRG